MPDDISTYIKSSKWDQYNTSNGAFYKMTNSEFTMETHFHARRMAFWANVVERVLHLGGCVTPTSGRPDMPVIIG